MLILKRYILNKKYARNEKKKLAENMNNYYIELIV